MKIRGIGAMAWSPLVHILKTILLKKENKKFYFMPKYESSEDQILGLAFIPSFKILS